jgi:TatD DNase family protein
VFIDSHCHLNRLDLAPYDGSLDRALEAARAVGVSRFLAVSVDLDDYGVLRDIAERHTDVGFSVGAHPCESAEMLNLATVETLVTLAMHPKVWAIGETGLDYHYSTDNADVQRESFARHIAAGKQTGKPVIVHTRAARADTLAVLREQHAEHGVLHCFTEDLATAEGALALGYYVSFSGIISFKNAQDLRDVAARVPLDRLLIETDSPYLAPMPYRGKSNEPLYLPHVARVLADVHQISVERLAEVTSLNFDRMLKDALSDTTLN